MAMEPGLAESASVRGGRAHSRRVATQLGDRDEVSGGQPRNQSDRKAVGEVVPGAQEKIQGARTSTSEGRFGKLAQKKDTRADGPGFSIRFGCWAAARGEGEARIGGVAGAAVWVKRAPWLVILGALLILLGSKLVRGERAAPLRLDEGDVELAPVQRVAAHRAQRLDCVGGVGVRDEPEALCVPRFAVVNDARVFDRAVLLEQGAELALARVVRQELDDKLALLGDGGVARRHVEVAPRRRAVDGAVAAAAARVRPARRRRAVVAAAAVAVVAVRLGVAAVGLGAGAVVVVGVGVGDGLEAAFTVDVGPAPPPPGSAPAPLKALSGMKPAIPGHMAGGTGADGCGNGDVALPFAPLPAYGIGAGGNAPVAVMGGTPGKAPPAYGIAPKGGIMAYGFPKPAAGGKPAGHPFGAKPAPFVPFAPAVNEVVAPLVCGTGARAAFDPACLLSAGANVCVDDIFQLRSFAVEDEQQEVSKGVTTAAEWICAVSGGTTGSASTPQKNGSQGDGPACERETGGNCFAREKSAPLRTTVCCQAVAFRLGDENAGTVRVSSTGHRRVLALFVLTASTLDRKGFS
eukprot:CAMPEP_0174857572 /NCGR_PEP_ID=MMETSP1114-20130205/39459_1 /TAXON_ID=312471 /ORGANISM="Neobodo designis, Strain CCAP 1951/1" /LENGTH=575 /DNA_ID=CAMNT_0016092435 /DNA_START=486 /DNA_END=2216 /DNA_ORIENTATION=+